MSNPTTITDLRKAVRTAWLTGTEDFRRHYDKEVLALLGCTTFQDLYQPTKPTPDNYSVDGKPATDGIKQSMPYSRIGGAD